MATEARFKDDYLLKRSYAGSARYRFGAIKD